MAYEHENTLSDAEKSLNVARGGIVFTVLVFVFFFIPLTYYLSKALIPVTWRRIMPMLLIVLMVPVVFFSLPEGYLICALRPAPDAACVMGWQYEYAAYISEVLMGVGSIDNNSHVVAYLRLALAFFASLAALVWLFLASRRRPDDLRRGDPGKRLFWNQSIPPVLFYAVGLINIFVCVLPLIAGAIPPTLIATSVSINNQGGKEEVKNLYLSFQTLEHYLTERRHNFERNFTDEIKAHAKTATPIQLQVLNVDGRNVVDLGSLMDADGFVKPGTYSLVAIYPSKISYWPFQISPKPISLLGYGSFLPGLASFKNGEVWVPLLLTVTEREHQRRHYGRHAEAELFFREDGERYLGLAARLNNLIINLDWVGSRPIRTMPPPRGR